MNERAELDKLTDRELVAYWNVLNTPCLKVDDGKIERHTTIVDDLLTSRNIPHEPGKRTELAEPAHDVLKIIRDARDYCAEHGEHPEMKIGDTVYQCFDDWAADLADTVLKD